VATTTELKMPEKRWDIQCQRIPTAKRK